MTFSPDTAVAASRHQADAGWAVAAVGIHVILLVLIGRLYGGLEPLYSLHDAGYYIAHLEDVLLQGDLSSWDNVPYRAIRVGVVILALPVRFLGAAQALIVVNLAFLVIGTVSVRRIARANYASDRLASVLWILNPGALVATALLLPDTVVWSLVLAFVLLMSRGRWLAATPLAVLAVLVKEAALLSLAAVAVIVALQRRDWRSLVPPAVAFSVHQLLLYLLVQSFGPSFHGDFVGWPLAGWIDVWQFWAEADFIPVSQILGVVVLASGLLVLVAWVRRPTNLTLATAGAQALLMLVLDSVVLFTYSNTTRIGQIFWPALAATRESGRVSGQPMARTDA